FAKCTRGRRVAGGGRSWLLIARRHRNIHLRRSRCRLSFVATAGERGVSVVLVLLLVAALALCAFAFATSRGEEITIQKTLGLVGSLVMVAGFVAFYLREARLHPDEDDDDGRNRIMGRVVVKLGCLFFVIAVLSAVVMPFIFGR